MQIIKIANLAIAFLLEITMFVSLGYYGYLSSENLLLKYFLMVLLPLAAIFLWVFFAAPRSEYRLAQPYRMLFALGLFAITAFLLYKSGHAIPAAIFAAIALVSQLTAFVLRH